MMFTEQDEVCEVGGSAVVPVDDVVALAVTGWLVAAGEGAAPVKGANAGTGWPSSMRGFSATARSHNTSAALLLK